MIATTLSQPERQLGSEFANLLSANRPYNRIIFVSAFTALRTILRLRESMLAAADNGAIIRLTLGIDLRGTSREVLEELLRWDCEVFIYHNPIPRATFHPKIYLFESESDSTLFLGSNNLTDGGLYTNYESAIRFIFHFPDDATEYARLLLPINPFLEPSGPTVRRLNAELIETLSTLYILTTESEARRSRREGVSHVIPIGTTQPPNPFTPESVSLPPLLPREIRDTLVPVHTTEPPNGDTTLSFNSARPEGILVWRKVLPRTDALQVHAGSHHVGGVRLTQARFENPIGQRIDQTTYFRRLFDDYDWESEPGGHEDQEHTFVPIRIIIRGHDYGIHNFEISHKPSGEAGQDNYTTILRWGRDFRNVIEQANLIDTIFSLYEIPNSHVSFFIEITDQ